MKKKSTWESLNAIDRAILAILADVTCANTNGIAWELLPHAMRQMKIHEIPRVWKVRKRIALCELNRLRDAGLVVGSARKWKLSPSFAGFLADIESLRLTRHMRIAYEDGGGIS